MKRRCYASHQWLTGEGLRAKRDYAMLAVLMGCGLRTSELTALEKVFPQNVVWYVVRNCWKRAGLDHIAPLDLRRTCAKLCDISGGELEQIQFLLGHASVQTTEHYLGCKQNLGHIAATLSFS